jgi:hypothetical protein
MVTFGCKIEAVINHGKFFRRYPTVSNGNSVLTDKLIVNTGGECKLLLSHYEKLNKTSEIEGLTNEVSDDVIIITESDLTQYEFFPARIGRMSAKILSNTLYLHEELVPLDMQCDVLKSKKPKKTHFRFAVVNGFGTQLGDCTIGITAMREVANFLAKKFNSFSIDFLFGPLAKAANADIVSFEPWVGQIFFDGPTLQDFARYDAYFDFSGLVELPKFTEMPTVDWYLWWMGLNPNLIDAEKKRNRMTIRWDAWESVTQLLKGISGNCVLFNPRASVPLRSIPESVAIEITKKLLALDTTLQLVIDQPLNFKHKRLIDLSGKIDSPAKFKALVAQVDGLITVDSFAPQLADACSVPTVHLCATLPASYYPYYPYSAIVEIPNSSSLSGWRKFDLNTHEEWQEMKHEYTEAWKNLDVKCILQKLDEKIILRNQYNEIRRISFTSHSPSFEATKIHNGLHFLKYDYPSPFWNHSQQRLSALANSVLKVGMTALLVGAGQSNLPVTLAQILGSLGVLHIFEPRWQRRTLITNDIVAKSSLQKLYWHDALPIVSNQKININDNDPFGESNPEEWGNLRRRIEIATFPIDTLELIDCHAIILTPPTPWKSVIDGFLNTLQKHRPFLFFAPINSDDVIMITSTLKDIDYQFWAESALDHGNMDKQILIGFPNEKNVNTSGFMKIMA